MHIFTYKVAVDGASISSEIKGFFVGFLSRVVWAIATAILIFIVFLTLGRFGGVAEEYLEREISSFPFSFPILFGLSLFGLVYWWFLHSTFRGAISTDTQTDAGDILDRTVHAIKNRVRQFSVKTRIGIANCLRWTSYCCLLIMLISLLLTIREILVGDILGRFANIGIGITLLSFYAAGICAVIGRFVMNRYDWIVEHLQNFQKHGNLDDLNKALINYNRILGFTLSTRKLLEISQRVKEVYTIGEEKALKAMDREIITLIDSGKTRDVKKLDRSLIKLSASAEKKLSEHQKRLGFKVRYPIRLRIIEHTKNAFGKIFPQLMLIMIWLVIIIVLMHVGIITFPPSLP